MATRARSLTVRILRSTMETWVSGGSTAKGHPTTASTLSLSLSAVSPSKITLRTLDPLARYRSQWTFMAVDTSLNSFPGTWSSIVRCIGVDTVMRNVCPFTKSRSPWRIWGAVRMFFQVS